ncbi:MAG: hypothetical protein Q9223_007211 [Gallowayella weberi]
MLDYPEQHSRVGHRRNAIKPGEVEHLIKNRNGRQHPPWVMRSMPKRKRSTNNRHQALDSSPEARVEVTQRYEVGLRVLSPDGTTPIKTRRHGGITHLESQAQYPTEARPTKKRKRTALFNEYECECDDMNFLDAFHPSEIRLGESYMDNEAAEIHDQFPTQDYPPQSQ